MECLNKTVYFHFCMKNVSCVVKSRFTLYYKYTYIVEYIESVGNNY